MTVDADGRRMQRPTVLALLGLAAVLAGCFGADAPVETAATDAAASASGPAAAPSAPAVERFETEGVVTADAMHAVESHGLDVDVREGAVALVVELRWTPAEQDLDLVLTTPDFCPGGPVEGLACAASAWAVGGNEDALEDEGGVPGAGGGAARIEVDAARLAAEACDRTRCTWEADVTQKVAVQASFELKAAVFYGDAPPAGWSPFDGA